MPLIQHPTPEARVFRPAFTQAFQAKAPRPRAFRRALQINQFDRVRRAYTLPRMKHAPTHLQQKELDRYQAALLSWLVWALLLIFRLGVNAYRSNRLKRVMTRCERFTHAVLICTAFARLRKTNAHARPLNTAPGIRAHRGSIRLLARRLRLKRGTFYQRILRMLEIFGKPEPHVARFLRTLRAGPRLNLVLATPVAAATLSAEAREIACADSS